MTMFLRPLLILSLLVLSPLCRAGFDFRYETSSAGIRLVQAFDDGQKTYLVLGKDTEGEIRSQIAKAVVAFKDGRLMVPAITESQPYWVADGIYDRIVVAVGNKYAVAKFKGDRNQPPPEEHLPAQFVPPVGSSDAASKKVPEPERLRPIDLAASPFDPPPQSTVVKPVVKPSNAEKASGAATGGERTAPPTEIIEPHQVVQVAAPVVADPPPSNPPIKGKGRSDKAKPVKALPVKQESVPVQEGDRIRYQVTVPVSTGKQLFTKESDEAIKEIAEVGALATEIVIEAPVEPSSGPAGAHARASELYRRLVKAGLVAQTYTMKAVAPVASKGVELNVLLMVGSNNLQPLSDEVKEREAKLLEGQE